MNGALADGEGGFAECFAEGGMDVTGAGEIFAAGGEGNRDGGFVDEVAGVGSDDVDPFEAIGFGVGEDFNGAFDLAEGAGATVGAKGKNAFAILEARVFELFFGLTDRSDFGVGIDDAGDGIVIDMAVTGDELFDASDPLLLGFMSEHGAGDDVADGVDTFSTGGETFVDRNEAFFMELDADAFQAEVVGVGDASDGDEDAIADDGFGALAADDALVVAHFGGGDASVQAELEALFFKEFTGLFGDFGIHAREDAVEKFEDDDFGAEPIPNRTQLEADVTGADDDQSFGDGRIRQGFGAGADAVAVEGDAGQGCGFTAGGEEDVFGFELDGFGGTFDEDSAGTIDSPVAGVTGDVVFPE